MDGYFEYEEQMTFFPSGGKREGASGNCACYGIGPWKTGVCLQLPSLPTRSARSVLPLSSVNEVVTSLRYCMIEVAFSWTSHLGSGSCLIVVFQKVLLNTPISTSLPLLFQVICKLEHLWTEERVGIYCRVCSVHFEFSELLAAFMERSAFMQRLLPFVAYFCIDWFE